MVFAAVLVLALLIYFARFLLRLPIPTRNAFLIAGALFVSGAVVVEGLFVVVSQSHPMTRVMMFTTEESLEFAGVILFIRALLGYLTAQFGEIRFVLGSARAPEAARRARGESRAAEPV